MSICKILAKVVIWLEYWVVFLECGGHSPSGPRTQGGKLKCFQIKWYMLGASTKAPTILHTQIIPLFRWEKKAFDFEKHCRHNIFVKAQRFFERNHSNYPPFLQISNKILKLHVQNAAKKKINEFPSIVIIHSVESIYNFIKKIDGTFGHSGIRRTLYERF